MTETREEIEQWAALSDADWVALQVPRFVAIRPRCLGYADFLRAVLKQGAPGLRRWPSSRPAPRVSPVSPKKSSASASSICIPRRPARRSAGPHDRPLRRAGHHPDLRPGAGRLPLHRGGLRHRRSNSEDVSQRLRPTEFGYRSVHYIVSGRSAEARTPASRSPCPEEILGLKAEIQVRTLLEHAWADIGHEMTYKTE